MARKAKIQMFAQEWRAATSLSGVYALRMLGMFLVLPVLALHAHKLAQADLKQVGMVMAAYGLTQALLQLPLGMLSDKIGRKKVIYLGMSVFALGSFWAAAADTVEALVCARAMQGAGAVSAAVTALLADLTREEVRTRAMSMIGVEGLFVLMGVLSMASIALVAGYTPEPTRLRMHQDTQAKVGYIGTVLKDRQLLRLNWGIFVLQAGLMAMFTVLPFALRELGWDKAEHWKVYLPATVIGLALMVPAIIIGETRNKLKPVCILGIGLVLASQAALIFSLGSVWTIGVALVVYFIGFNILEASMPSLVSKIAPANLKGTAMGVYNTMQSLGLFTGGMMGSRAYEAWGYTGVFVLCCVLMALWLVLAWTAPAPLPVKNVVYAVPEHWRAQLDELQRKLQAASGVQAVSFSDDRETVFIKAWQQGFDEESVKQILGVS